MGIERELFTPNQIAQQSMLNAEMLSLAATVFAKKKGLAPRELWRLIGAQFAPGWTAFGSESPTEIAKHMVLNMVSLGGALLSLTGDENRAEAVMEGWPSARALSFLEITLEDADATWGVFEPIVESLGWVYKWAREGNKITFTLTGPT